MAFPTSPSYGDTHSLGGKTYRFGGVYWSAVNLADQLVERATDAFMSPKYAYSKETFIDAMTTPNSNAQPTLLNYQ